jgi:hypothetical protein
MLYDNWTANIDEERHASITNCAFGAVYPYVDGKAYPVCDTAWYAPFGFGYRACAGVPHRWFLQGSLKKCVEQEDRLNQAQNRASELLPVGPRTVVPDNIGFKRTR